MYRNITQLVLNYNCNKSVNVMSVGSKITLFVVSIPNMLGK
jgi:hypothetical protein